MSETRTVDRPCRKKRAGLRLFVGVSVKNGATAERPDE
jgi:hypothetical protein